MIAFSRRREGRFKRVLSADAGHRRILLPFTSAVDSSVLSAAIEITRAQRATLVLAYLLTVPLEYGEHSPPTESVLEAQPVLEAVEQVAVEAGVAVDARIAAGRSATDALRRLWRVERFDRTIAAANGFTTKELSWMITHAPMEALIFKPSPPREPLDGTRERDDDQPTGSRQGVRAGYAPPGS